MGTALASRGWRFAVVAALSLSTLSRADASSGSLAEESQEILKLDAGKHAFVRPILQWAIDHIEAEEWVLMGVKPGRVLFAKRGPNDAAPGKAMIWRRIEYQEPLTFADQSMRSEVDLLEFDCSGQSYTVVRRNLYGNNNIDSPLKEQPKLSGKWNIVNPQSDQDQYMYALCDNNKVRSHP
jgi:hypothetical protein